MKIRNHILAIIGVGAFIICVLACRPEFSPDGKKVVFPVLDADSKQTTVMLYDRETRRLETIFTRPSQRDDVFAAAIWTPDGKHIVVATAEGEAGDKTKGPFMVAVLPLDRKGATRFLHVPENADVTSLYCPPRILGKHIFFGGETAITRLDLETGDIKTEALTEDGAGKKDSVFVFGKGERLFYMRSKEDAAEIGALDPETLGTRAILHLNKNETTNCNVFPAVSKDGSRIAVALGKEAHTQIRIYHRDALERTLVVGTTNEPVTLGNLLWSSDEKLIYAAAFKSIEESNGECGLCEIPVGGEKVRSTPLCVTKEYDLARVAFQIALSPDGKCIAASTGYASGDGESRALYLVDLRRAKRPVRKVTVPIPKSGKLGMPASER